MHATRHQVQYDCRDQRLHASIGFARVGLAWTLAGLLAALLAGCKGTAPGEAAKGFDPTANLTTASGKAAGGPVALVGGERVSWDDLHAALAESAGAEVLDEYALGVLVHNELAARGLRLDDKTIQAERAAFGAMLTRTVGASEDDRERLIADICRRRGLGPVRFSALLERNAGLRSLIRSDPSLSERALAISDDDVATAYTIKYGPRMRARIIVTPTYEEAERARARLEKESFAEVASAASVDSSSQRGGMLEPLSLEDPSYPILVRTELNRLSPGAISRPLSVDWNGRSAVAILRLEERLPAIADPPSLETSKPVLLEEIRAVRERVAMERLARKLMTAQPPTVLDRSLGWSWDNARQAASLGR